MHGEALPSLHGKAIASWKFKFDSRSTEQSPVFRVRSPQITNGHIPTQEAKDYLDVERRKFPAPLGRQRISAAKAPAGCRDTAQQKASRTGQESSQRAQGRGNDKKVQLALNEAC